MGLGIMGKEGRAAVRAADFAFAKFRFLQRIILVRANQNPAPGHVTTCSPLVGCQVHGHWYYHRVSMLVHYFFYKNVACFGQFSAFSLNSNNFY